MGEVVNLRQRRKAQLRAVKQQVAAAARALHGRSLAERQSEAADSARRAALLDGTKLDR